MPSRISGACNGCRTKKQKCSGDRSGCAQCHAAGVQCTWPEQRKRGPAKGYIEGLEHRLHEAETLLLALLPLVSPDQLNSATDFLNPNSISNIMGMKSRDSASPSPRNMRSSPPVLNKKTGIEYWESFPLDTVENIRKWQQDCALHSSVPPQRESQGPFDDLHTDVHQLHQNSRPSSVDLKRENVNGIFGPSHRQSQGNGHNQSNQFSSMSSDSYRSGTSTPVHITSAAQQPQNQPQQQQTSQQQQSWQNLSFLSPLPTHSNAQSSPGTMAPSNNTTNAVGIGAEAMLLQSFADSNWSQQNSLNNDMAGMGMSVESGPMEIDTGFFSSDMQRRLFW